MPGYGGATGGLERLAATLRATGRTATVVALPGDGTSDLRTSAAAVGAAVRAAVAGGAPSVDLVGYSAGGVVARLVVADVGVEHVRRVVTLGSPHHGTEVAALGAALLADGCPPACRQLVPGSPLLERLNAGDETPAGPAYLSVWTDPDELVRPAASARLAGAVDVPLARLCPGARVTHQALPTDPRVTALVVQAVSAAPLRPPARCPA